MSKASKKILIIEDDRRLMRALSDTLTSEGFDILEARNGKEGLRIALEVIPDLILLDIVMPKMDGMTMMKKLREENKGTKKISIIILTNLDADAKILRRVVEDKPSYYLIKSEWRVEDIVVKVREVLLQ